MMSLPPEQGGLTAREPYHGGVPLANLISLHTPFQEALDGAGISENTAHVWQKVARVPEDKFEIYFTEAERRLGEILKANPPAKGTRGMGRPKIGGIKQEPPKDDIPTLEQLGVTKRESAEAQMLASIPRGF